MDVSAAARTPRLPLTDQSFMHAACSVRQLPRGGQEEEKKKNPAIDAWSHDIGAGGMRNGPAISVISRSLWTNKLVSCFWRQRTSADHG